MRPSRHLRLARETLTDLGTDELVVVGGEPGPDPTPPQHISLPIVVCPASMLVGPCMTPPYSNHC